MITREQAIKILEHAQSDTAPESKLDRCLRDVFICLDESVERAQRYMISNADVSSDAKRFIHAILICIEETV